MSTSLSMSNGMSIRDMVKITDSTCDIYFNISNNGIKCITYNPMMSWHGALCRYRIHVVDLDPVSLSAGGWLEDTSLVKKFELTDEEYNKRAGMCRSLPKPPSFY